LFLAFVLLAMPFSVQAANRESQIAGYRALAQQDARLATIGHRLAFANSAYCPERAYSLGWTLHDIDQYPDQEIARAAFGFNSEVVVAAVVAGGPAALAGVQAGDGLVQFNLAAHLGIAPPKIAKIPPRYDRIDNIKQVLSKEMLKSPSINLGIERAGADRSVTLTGQLICASDFQIDTTSGRDAGADGGMVSVTYDLANFLPDDGELAAVVAHELSHNILKHRTRLEAAKATKGAARKTLLRLVDTEIEADRLSVWLMANAGYDPAAAIRFWQRYGPTYGSELFMGGGHLRWKKRVVLLENEIAQIAKAPKSNGAFVPPLLAAAKQQ
jgi:hypothetical protein